MLATRACVSPFVKLHGGLPPYRFNLWWSEVADLPLVFGPFQGLRTSFRVQLHARLRRFRIKSLPFPTAVEVRLGFNCLATTPHYFFGFGFDPMSPPLPNGVLYSTPQPSRGWKVRVSRTLVRAIVKPPSICGLVVAPSSCFRGLRSVTCPSLLGPRVCHPFEQVSEWKACASCSRCFQLHMVLPGRLRQCCSIAMFPVLQYEELSEASWLMRLVCDSRVGSEGGVRSLCKA